MNIFGPHRFLFVCLLGFTFFTAVLFAQHQRELESIRSEIRKYEKDLKQKEFAEERALDLIHKLDREVGITRQKLRRLNREISRKEQQIRSYEQQIKDLQNDIVKLRDLIKDRLVYYFKYGKSRRIELLMKTRSFSQLKVWMHYQKVIAKNDKRNLESLRYKKTQLEKTLELVKIEVKEKQQKITERSSERENLQQSLHKRERYLVRLQDSKEIIAQKLEQVREAERQISRMITRAEEERILEEARASGQRQISGSYKSGDSIEKYRGKMIWPAKGNVIGHFGKHRHPRFKTITENLGIEIQTLQGAPILAVAEGYVKTITYQRGRGNIVILSHADGYYSVYANLGEIYVNVNDEVDMAQEIGTVGQSVLYNEPVLHFQLWKNTNNLDPEDWMQ
jgi:septal ring factor EnvC (AmiA/AmiB activator)